ncbi:interleukin-17 receptor A [Lycodopsis pacificus]
MTWIIKGDGGAMALCGSEIKILDESTNQSMCVQFSYNLSKQPNPTDRKSTFSLDGVVVEPRHTYTVSVFNLPEPEIRDYRYMIREQISIPDPVNTSSSAAKQQPESFKVQDRKRVLVIYSLDHPLYKNIVLKLCDFLASKCGTEVVLDLLDSTRLGVLGSIQWLDWHRDQIESSSDKILILCSRGVQAKWRAMCGDKQVFLREDACSPVGDMLSPALSLMVPHFVRSASFKKYIVAYFDEVCCEEDVPSPFNITVRYKLMKQFEELFFRILDTEKHEPGRVNLIEGLSEDEYYHCPSGRALRDAIEAFHAYQLERPQWFEEELLGSSNTSVEIHDDAKTTINLMTYCVPVSTQVTSHVKTEESDFTGDKTGLYVTE